MHEKLLMPHLPEEIIVEILSRLPLASLLRFRCVSKPWSFLFNNPKLIYMIKNKFSIMLISGNVIYSIDNESLSPSSSLLDVIDSRIKKIHCPVSLRYRMKASFVSCFGLFCVRTSSSHFGFSLWNPSTGYYKEIPSPPKHFQLNIYYAYTIGYGLGYDSRSDDYKFVRTRRYFNEDAAEIYSLKLNSWKRIQHIPASVFSGTCNSLDGVFCNGALHWESSASNGLGALHMTDESIVEMSGPENLDLDFPDSCATYIDVLDGCLGVLYCNSEHGFEVWLMRDYGKRESWTKLYRISKLTPLKLERFLGLRRIKFLKTGELLLEVCYIMIGANSREALVLYDPKTKKSRELKLDEDIWASESLSLFHTYVKSSVSVSTDTNVSFSKTD